MFAHADATVNSLLVFSIESLTVDSSQRPAFKYVEKNLPVSGREKHSRILSIGGSLIGASCVLQLFTTKCLRMFERSAGDAINCAKKELES